MSLIQVLVWATVLQTEPELKITSAQTLAWLVHISKISILAWTLQAVPAQHRAELSKEGEDKPGSASRTGRENRLNPVSCKWTAVFEGASWPSTESDKWDGMHENVWQALHWTRWACPGDPCCQKCLFFIVCSHDEFPTLKSCSVFFCFP